MREYTKKPENQSHTLDSDHKMSGQAPGSKILQAYKTNTLGREGYRQGTDSKSGNVIQRVLNIGGEIRESKGDEVIQQLIEDDKIWHFRTLDEAKSVGKMIKTMKETIANTTYIKKPEAELNLNNPLYEILKYFRDPDHSTSNSEKTSSYNSIGQYSEPFNIKQLESYKQGLLKDPDSQQVREESDIFDPNPSEGRVHEALITAIKLKSMTDLSGTYKLYGVQAVDYVLENDKGKQYGFDPFELPKNQNNKVELSENQNKDQSKDQAQDKNKDKDIEKKFQDWLKDTYEKHVRTKK